MFYSTMEKTFGELVKEAMLVKNISARKLWMQSGVSRQYIGLIIKGRSHQVSIPKRLAIAKALEIPQHLALGLEEYKEHEKSLLEKLEKMISTAEKSDVGKEIDEVVDLPILGYVPAGLPFPSEQESLGMIGIPRAQLGYAREFPGLYVLIVTGDSLIGDDIQPGDKLIVNPNDKSVVDGKIYVVRVDNEVTVKHVIMKDDRMVLKPSNHKYKNLAPDQVEILGRVILAGNWKEL